MSNPISNKQLTIVHDNKSADKSTGFDKHLPEADAGATQNWSLKPSRIYQGVKKPFTKNNGSTESYAPPTDYTPRSTNAYAPAGNGGGFRFPRSETPLTPRGADDSFSFTSESSVPARRGGTENASRRVTFDERPETSGAPRYDSDSESTSSARTTLQDFIPTEPTKKEVYTGLYKYVDHKVQKQVSKVIPGRNAETKQERLQNQNVAKFDKTEAKLQKAYIAQVQKQIDTVETVRTRDEDGPTIELRGGKLPDGTTAPLGSKFNADFSNNTWTATDRNGEVVARGDIPEDYSVTGNFVPKSNRFTTAASNARAFAKSRDFHDKTTKVVSRVAEGVTTVVGVPTLTAASIGIGVPTALVGGAGFGAYKAGKAAAPHVKAGGVATKRFVTETAPRALNREFNTQKTAAGGVFNTTKPDAETRMIQKDDARSNAELKKDFQSQIDHPDTWRDPRTHETIIGEPRLPDGSVAPSGTKITDVNIAENTWTARTPPTQAHPQGREISGELPERLMVSDRSAAEDIKDRATSYFSSSKINNHAGKVARGVTTVAAPLTVPTGLAVKGLTFAGKTAGRGISQFNQNTLTPAGKAIRTGTENFASTTSTAISGLTSKTKKAFTPSATERTADPEGTPAAKGRFGSFVSKNTSRVTNGIKNFHIPMPGKKKTPPVTAENISTPVVAMRSTSSLNDDAAPQPLTNKNHLSVFRVEPGETGFKDFIANTIGSNSKKEPSFEQLKQFVANSKQTTQPEAIVQLYNKEIVNLHVNLDATSQHLATLSPHSSIDNQKNAVASARSALENAKTGIYKPTVKLIKLGSEDAFAFQTNNLEKMTKAAFFIGDAETKLASDQPLSQQQIENLQSAVQHLSDYSSSFRALEIDGGQDDSILSKSTQVEAVYGTYPTSNKDGELQENPALTGAVNGLRVLRQAINDIPKSTNPFTDRSNRKALQSQIPGELTDSGSSHSSNGALTIALAADTESSLYTRETIQGKPTQHSVNEIFTTIEELNSGKILSRAQLKNLNDKIETVITDYEKISGNTKIWINEGYGTSTSLANRLVKQQAEKYAESRPTSETASTHTIPDDDGSSTHSSESIINQENIITPEKINKYLNLYSPENQTLIYMSHSDLISERNNLITEMKNEGAVFTNETEYGAGFGIRLPQGDFEEKLDKIELLNMLLFNQDQRDDNGGYRQLILPPEFNDNASIRSVDSTSNAPARTSHLNNIAEESGGEDNASFTSSAGNEDTTKYNSNLPQRQQDFINLGNRLDDKGYTTPDTLAEAVPLKLKSGENEEVQGLVAEYNNLLENERIDIQAQLLAKNYTFNEQTGAITGYPETSPSSDGALVGRYNELLG